MPRLVPMKLSPWMLFLFVPLVLFTAALIWAYTPDRSRAWLEARYLQSADDLVSVAGTTLHLRDEGPREAPAVVLLHGMASSLHTWDPWVEVLSQDLRVIRLDLPGGGLSSLDPTGIYTDDRTVDILVALLEERGLERASFVGHSLGGRIAWRFAAAHPERVDRLILIAPDGYESEGVTYNEAPNIPVFMDAFAVFLPRSFLKSNLVASFGEAQPTPELVDRYYDLLRAPGARKALIQRMRQTVLPVPEPLLAQITAPTLVMWGTMDSFIPVSNAQDYLAALPSARLVTYPEIGHVPMEEDPAGTVGAVLEHLTAPLPALGSPKS